MDESRLGDAEGMRDEIINISDVIEVIETDPDFTESTMFNGGGEVSQQPFVQPQPPQPSQGRRRPFVRIVEQPASKALRFRYECEGRSAGSIPGASSSPENKTFPSIQVIGYKGRAVVVVSCVTKDEPYRPHPHNLVGREGCKKGVCTLEISPDTMCVTFSNLGIQCVKKKDIESALRVREEIKVDPYMTGFNHRNQPTSIDLNAVRLCFQVFLEGERAGKFTVPLQPVVSEPIFDKKAMSDLIICKLSHCNVCVDGGRNEIILLCEKVAKDDIQIRFFEEKDGMEVWEEKVEIQPAQVHKQTAISFRPPKYHTTDITDPVKVSIQLFRPSDQARSEPLPFEFLPYSSEPDYYVNRKRPKISDSDLRKFKTFAENNHLNQQYQPNIPLDGIKVEPRDKAPSPYGGHVYNTTLSPRYPTSTSVSPHHMGPTPPPLDTLTFTQPTTSALPPFGNMMQQNWNVPGMNITQTWSYPAAGGEPGAESASGLSSLLNLDSQQMELRELSDLNLEADNLSATFTQNVSLSEITMEHDQRMMSDDSFTRLANSALEKFS